MAATSSHRAQSVRHIAFQSVGSTNEIAFEKARAGDCGGLWITAERQTAGRGRRGRPWVSDTGNLYASYLLIDPAEADHIGEMPLVVALGVRDAILSATQARLDIKVKWPNDLLADGAKIAGILLEAEILADGRRAVVVGIGVNCAVAPPMNASEQPATSLARLGAAVDPKILFAHLTKAMDHVTALWRRGAGFPEIRERWLAASAGLGRPIRVRLPNCEDHGTFEALDEAGRLVLRRADGSIATYAAGDVFLGGAANGETRS